MSDFPQHINNSYESGSSSSNSTNNSNYNVLEKSIRLDRIEGNVLTALMVNESGNDLYNTSAEEGIFPNVSNYQEVQAPSYQRDYDYQIEYSNTPLVYSWLPIVPGFNPDGFNNLHNFEHLGEKVCGATNSSPESAEISNQNLKYRDYLVINNKETNLINNSCELEDSCNAVDLNISFSAEANLNPDLSFVGKFTELALPSNENDPGTDNTKQAEPEESFDTSIKLNQTECIEANTEQFTIINDEENQAKTEQLQDENLDQFTIINDEENPDKTEQLLNESYEDMFTVISDEDTNNMSQSINEKSPEVLNSSVLDCDNEAVVTNNKSKEEKLPEDCDGIILNKLRQSLAGMCPPPSVTAKWCQISLSEMLIAYYKNTTESPSQKENIASSSLFIPTCQPKEAQTMDWPKIRTMKCLDVAYNKSTDSEDIEVLCLRYGERFLSAQTISSFNNKVGPSSAKKKSEKLKLMTQSPGRRLSHLANRRKIFSSENLKSSSLTKSHSIGHTSSRFLINKSVLYSKASKTKSPLKRSSAKKKTPGKKKTPKSAKRQLITRPETSRNSSKRALFTSPTTLHHNLSLPCTSKEPTTRGTGPRKALFSPVNDENRKRRSSISPDHEVDNRRKLRRLESPTKMPKSQSFSIASTSTNSNLNESFRKQLFTRTQSEVFPKASESTASLGYKEPMTSIVTKKLLWSVSNALKMKQISNEHQKFKEYATLLASLVKKIFIEFYDPTNKSLSTQMAKFSNFMVYFVIQGQSKDEILKATRNHLQSKITTKVSGYVAPQEYERNKQFNFRRNNSLLLTSSSYSSLNYSHASDSSFDDLSSTSSRLPLSRSSINLSSSKNNELGGALRENFQSRENSARKLSGSDSSLNRAKSSSSLMKAKRQISF